MKILASDFGTGLFIWQTITILFWVAFIYFIVSLVRRNKSKQ